MTQISLDYNALGNITTTTSGTNVHPWSTWQQWLNEVTYKPGWSFELRDYGYPYANGYTVMMGGNAITPGLSVLITAKVIDSVSLDETIIVHTLPLPPTCLGDRESFLSAVLHCVHMVEAHETMEFFKAMGVRVRNPHPSVNKVLYS